MVLAFSPISSLRHVFEANLIYIMFNLKVYWDEVHIIPIFFDYVSLLWMFDSHIECILAVMIAWLDSTLFSTWTTYCSSETLNCLNFFN